MPPLILQNDAIVPSYSISHYSPLSTSPEGHYAGHTLGVSEVKLQAETQTDANTFEHAVAQPTNLTSRRDEALTQADRRPRGQRDALCAKGRRRSVRQMRLRLLVAEGCLNGSFDYFGKLERTTA